MNILADKSYSFAVRIVKLSHYLQNDKKEFILSKQVLRSGTSIGALVAESVYAQSKADFISKLQRKIMTTKNYSLFIINYSFKDFSLNFSKGKK